MKNQRGITLIALVITIIVLLILAGVSIAMLTGQNGILTKASGSSEKSEIAEVDEAIRLGLSEILANHMDPTVEDTVADSNGVTGQITDTNLKKAIEENNSNLKGNTKLTTSGTGEITVTYKTDYTWTIDANGSITKKPDILGSTSAEDEEGG